MLARHQLLANSFPTSLTTLLTRLAEWLHVGLEPREAPRVQPRLLARPHQRDPQRGRRRPIIGADPRGRRRLGRASEAAACGIRRGGADTAGAGARARAPPAVTAARRARQQPIRPTLGPALAGRLCIAVQQRPPRGAGADPRRRDGSQPRAPDPERDVQLGRVPGARADRVRAGGRHDLHVRVRGEPGRGEEGAAVPGGRGPADHVRLPHERPVPGGPPGDAVRGGRAGPVHAPPAEGKGPRRLGYPGEGRGRRGYGPRRRVHGEYPV